MKEEINYDAKGLNLGGCKNIDTINWVIFRAKKVKLYFQHIELLKEKIIPTIYSTDLINGKFTCD